MGTGKGLRAGAGVEVEKETGTGMRTGKGLRAGVEVEVGKGTGTGMGLRGGSGIRGLPI